jgi:superfamily II DNA/RNA helicase
MQGINKPTAIQALAWPVLYSGRDLMCIGLPTSSRVISVNIFPSFISK